MWFDTVRDMHLPYDHFEGVYMEPSTGHYVYVTAEGASGNGLLWARDYMERDGLYEPASDWHHIGAHHLRSTLPMASQPAFSEVVALDYMREFAALQEYEDDPEMDVPSLLDVAQCHLLDHGMPAMPEGADYYAHVSRWGDILEACEIELD